MNRLLQMIGTPADKYPALEAFLRVTNWQRLLSASGQRPESTPVNDANLRSIGPLRGAVRSVP